MKLAKSKSLSHLREWKDFKMVQGKLELPTGDRITPQQLITAVALLSIQSELEIKTSTKLLKLARAMTKLK